MSKKSNLSNSLASKSLSDWTFADIIAPMTPEEFFKDYFGKKHLHISGAAGKFKNVMTWDILTDLLNMNSIWSSQSLMMSMDRNMVPAHEYCTSTVDRSGNQVMMPVPDLVSKKLEQGATMVCNDIDALGEGLRGVSRSLEQAFNGKSQANLYCSSRQRQAFQSHYDTHDVFAMHMEGEKIWRIYGTQEDFPIRHPAYIKDNAQMMQDRGGLVEEITLKPGDFLYVPRGKYHDALSSSDGCIHIAFGLTGYIGMDAIANIGAALVHQQLGRQNFPHLSEGREALKSHMEKLAKSIAETMVSDVFIDGTIDQIEKFHYERGELSLPLKATEITYEITSSDLKVTTKNGQAILVNKQQGIPIPPQLAEQVSWVIARKKFKRNAFTEKFSHFGIDALDKTLTDLQNMKILQPL